MADNYKVLTQGQTVQINPAGTGFEEVWDVTYKVVSGPAKGTVATVTLPTEDHEASAVQAAIESKIADLEAIASLGAGKNA